VVNIGDTMKKIVITAIIYLFGTAAMAETITILNNGKVGGSYNARSQLYKEGLEDRGHTVNFENIGKIGQAVKIFKETDQPTIMVYSTNQVYEQDLFHTEDNFLLLEYEQPMWICRTHDAVNQAKQIRVAHGKGYDTDIIKKALGTNIVLVPYKNSSAILNAMLAGDVDASVNNQGKSLQYGASGQGVCEPSDVLPVMQATVIGKNLDIGAMREVLLSITHDKKFVDYHSSNKLKRSHGTLIEELDSIKEKTINWKVNR
jgi:hypothetical protein